MHCAGRPPYLPVSLILSLVWICACRPSVAQATSTTTIQRIPIIYMYDPAVNGDLGEPVLVMADLQMIFHVVFDGSGGYHTDSQFRIQGPNGTQAAGIGLWTGTIYNVIDSSRIIFNAGSAQVTSGYWMLRFISPGSGANFALLLITHVIVNPDGSVDSWLDNALPGS